MESYDEEIIGTNKKDNIEGSSEDEFIDGGNGKDTIDGGAGDDIILGGNGKDTIDGGAGDDIILGGNGKDTIDGGAGDDIILGGNGKDTIDGGAGDDLIDGGNGKDYLNGGDGDDIILGGNGNDILLGGSGDDLILGEKGADIIDAEDGNDIIILTNDGAADTVTLGEGFDELILDLSAGSDLGSDLITDFVIGEDKVDVLGADLSELEFYEQNGSTFLTIGSNVIELAGVTGVTSLNELTERPPVINNIALDAEILENTAIGAKVGEVSAIDPDGDMISYQLLEGGAAAEDFEINSLGEILVKGDLDFEDKSVYSLKVIVSDGLYDVEQDFQIELTDVDEAPTIDAINLDAEILENTAIGTKIGSVDVTDPEGGVISYQLLEGGVAAEDFEINSLGEILVKGDLDFEAKSSYSLKVVINDGVNEVEQSLAISLTDVDEDPVINSITLDAEILENTAIGTKIGSVDVTDPEGGVISYQLLEGGVAAEDFEINSLGEILVKGDLDFEAKSSYSLKVVINDGVNEVEQSLAISLTDVDEAPTIDAINLDAEILENTAIGTKIGSVDVTDPEGGVISYQLLEGGVAAEDFEINSLGEILVKGDLDFEAKSSYSLKVVIDDGVNEVEQSLAISLTDVDEAPPDPLAVAFIDDGDNVFERDQDIIIAEIIDVDGSDTLTDGDDVYLGYLPYSLDVNANNYFDGVNEVIIDETFELSLTEGAVNTNRIFNFDYGQSGLNATLSLDGEAEVFQLRFTDVFQFDGTDDLVAGDSVNDFLANSYDTEIDEEPILIFGPDDGVDLSFLDIEFFI